MEKLREILGDRGCYHINFGTRPSKLFEGAEQRLTIFVSVPHASKKLFSGGYKKWYADERQCLFQNFFYLNSASIELRNQIWPKLAEKNSATVLQKVIASGFLVQKGCLGSGATLHYKNTGLRYFNTVTKQSPKCWINGAESHSSRETLLHTSESSSAGIHCSLISTTFFMYWELVSNCRDLNPSDIHFFGMPDAVCNDKRFLALSNAVEKDCFTKSKIIKMNNKQTGLVEVQSLTTAQSKPIIDEIDKILAEHFGFTEEELDYIINYDIKYRMGKDLHESEEE